PSRRRHTRLVSDWSSDVCSSDLHPGQAVAVLRVDALGPEVRGLVGVAVGGDDEVLPGIVRARGARPAGVPRGIQPPQVRRVDLELAHVFSSKTTFHCTSVKGTLASSCASNTASTGAPMVTTCCGSPSRLPSMRMPPACGSSTSTTM